MVTRAYYCKNCNYEFETVQPMNETLKKKCPECKKNQLSQDLSGGTYTAEVKNYSTLGSIAEKNTKEMGLYERQEKEQAIKDKDQSMMQERNRKLEDLGYKVKTSDSKNKNSLPKHVIDRINSGDKQGVQRYIFEGR